MDKDETLKAQEQTSGIEAGGSAGTEGSGNEEQISALQKLMNGLFGGKGEKVGAEPAPEGKGGTPEVTDDAGKTFTQADIDAAVKSAEEKWRNEAAEAERLKKLSPEERAEEDAKKKDAELTELRAKVLETDLRKKAEGVLLKEKLPNGLLDLLDYTSEEKMTKGLDSLIPIYREAIEAGVKEKLRGKTPEGLGNAGGGENLLRAQIAKNVRGL